MKNHEELEARARAKEARNLAALHKQCETCAHWRYEGSTSSKARRCCHCILDTGHSRKQISPRKCGSWEDAKKITYKPKTEPVCM